jgi:lipoate-protein ligase A
MSETFSRAQWRVIHHPPFTGARNMAVDEAILEAVQEEKSPPTLRLYDWQPACLSLGIAQSLTDVDTGALAAHGWEMVRRPTGGRAILHIDELTYSVIGSPDEPRLAGGVLESYYRLSQGLMRSLEILALPVQRQNGKSENAADMNPICFEAPSDNEITLDGKKLVGSAQARRKGGVLQHGSLPLYGDIGRITQALVYDSEEERAAAADRVRLRAATVEVGLGRRVEWAEAAEAFVQGFGEALNIEFVAGELTTEEEQAADRWSEERYAAVRWTERA